MNRQALKGPNGRAHHIISIQVLRHPMVDRVLAHCDHECVIPGTGREKSESDRSLGVVRKERISGHLLLHKPGVGLVRR